MRRILICFALLMFVLVACDDESSLIPTPAQTDTPGPTVVPSATVGPLTTQTIDQLGISMMTPTSWKAPAKLNDNSYVLSPNGSTDTSTTSGPFMLLIVGNSAYFHSKLTIPDGLTNPFDQLTAIVAALNMLSPDIGEVFNYTDGKYPGAFVNTWERGNEQSITLMKSGPDQWIYVGAQSPEVYFKYYSDNLFDPSTASITLIR